MRIFCEYSGAKAAIHCSMDYDAQNTHFSIEKRGTKTHFSNSAADSTPQGSSQAARRRTERHPS